MTPEVRHELEGLVEEVVALISRLKRHNQPFATQLLEMAVLEIRSQAYDINDDELQALCGRMSGQDSPALQVVAPISIAEPAKPLSSARVVAISDVRRRSKCKRRS
jgi:hypothetical protein